MRGRFVVFEGGDGSGKSTQVARLVESLRARGLTVVATFEPGATPTGAVLRDVLLHGTTPVAPLAEALLMAADRAQHVAEVVAPALARGDWVVSDRFVASSLVYQGVVRGLGVDAIRAMNDAAVNDAVPDLVVVLDVAEAVARGRRHGAPDRMESEDAEFHAAVSLAYRELAPTEGWTILDGGADAEMVAAEAFEAVSALLEGSAR
jgi:dTMP kinase